MPTIRFFLISLSMSISEIAYSDNVQALFNLPLQELLDVEITGSKIKSRSLSDFISVKLIDKKTIDSSGAVTLDQLLWRLPEVAGFSANSHNAYYGEGEGLGASHINLRGLGANRTLVLLNGRRLANGGSGANRSPDLNTIPLAIVQRIEVLKSGASAIYGTDAIAGVINIITAGSPDQSLVDVSYGETQEHDGETTALNLIWRKHSNNGKVDAYVNRTERRAMAMLPRAACDLGQVGNDLVCYNSGSTFGGRGVLSDEDGTVVNFNEDPNGNGDFYEDYNPLKHNANVNKFLNTFNPTLTTSIGMFGSYAFTDFNFVFDLAYTDSDTNQTATPDSIGRNRAIVIPATNPTNPTGKDLTLQRRRLGEAGGREWIQNRNYKDLLLGLDGNFNNQWQWKTAFSWRENDSDEDSTNVSNLDHLENTLNTDICSNTPGADIPCADYLGAGDLTPEVLDYLMIKNLYETGSNRQIEVSADVFNDFTLKSGKTLGVAAGISYRDTQGERNPDPLDTAGIANANPTAPLKGEYAAREVFTELVWQVARDIIISGDRLDIDAAIRYSNYELFGGTTNYKLELDWQLKNYLSIHSSWTTGFRAPNIDELFLLDDTEQLNTNDPCNNWNTYPQDSPIYINCSKSGVPENYNQPTSAIATVIGGNIDLEPEKSETLSVGIVMSPTPNLTMGLGAVSTRIADAIEVISGLTKLRECYNSNDMNNNSFCNADTFTRNPTTGDINFLSAKKANLADERLSALDFSFELKFNLKSWSGKFNWDSSKMMSYSKTVYAGAEEFNSAGMIISGSGSYTKWRSLASLNLEKQKWRVDYGIRYIGSATDNTSQAGDFGHDVPAVNYHRIRIGFQYGQPGNVYFGITNIFDEKAPFVAGWLDANTDTMTYDLSGRSFYLGTKYNF